MTQYERAMIVGRRFKDSYEIDCGELFDELEEAVGQFLILQDTHAEDEGAGEKGCGDQLVGQDFEGYRLQVLLGQEPVQLGVPKVVGGTLRHPDDEHAAWHF